MTGDSNESPGQFFEFGLHVAKMPRVHRNSAIIPMGSAKKTSRRKAKGTQ